MSPEKTEDEVLLPPAATARVADALNLLAEAIEMIDERTGEAVAELSAPGTDAGQEAVIEQTIMSLWALRGVIASCYVSGLGAIACCNMPAAMAVGTKNKSTIALQLGVERACAVSRDAWSVESNRAKAAE